MAILSSDIIRQIESTGLVAIIRASGSGELVEVVKALREGGCTCIEVTMTTPNCLQVIAEARQTLEDDAVIGVGTVLDAETARAAIVAGAQFVVAPILDLATIEICRRYSVPVMPGAMTPTEIMRAWQAGADLVKVFPTSVLGARFLKDVRAPLPQVKLIPTGGINLDNVGEFIRAGAAAIGVGSALVTAEAIKKRDFAGIKVTAAQWLQRIRQARESR